MLTARKYGDTEPGHISGADKQSYGAGNAGANANGVPLSKRQEGKRKPSQELRNSIDRSWSKLLEC